MPRKQKIDRQRVMASLDTVCPKCGHSITPVEIRRVDFDHVECPACHEHFVPTASLLLLGQVISDRTAGEPHENRQHRVEKMLESRYRLTPVVLTGS